MIARRAVVTGRVQGVFFRAHVAEAAARHGVAGWAENLADGRVKIHAEGSEEGVEAVLAAARRGSPGADVESIAVDDAAVEGCSGFSSR